ncbi:MAG: hypothetical protein QXF29_04540, partial [Archaeoglobaceae archaeon]
DVSWEANGILDFSRNPKIFSSYLRLLNQEILPIYFDDKVYISNTLPYDFVGKLIIKDGDNKREIEVFVPAFSTSKVVEYIPKSNYIEFEIQNDEEAVGRNFYYLFKFEKDHENEDCLSRALNEEILKKISEEGETIFARLPQGVYLNGHLRVISENSQAFSFSNYIADWQGNWIGSFYYFHPSLRDIFSDFTGVLRLSNYITNEVILIDEELSPKILIGKYVGWCFAKCAYLVEIKLGKGRLIVTTLNLEKTSLLGDLRRKLGF